MLKKAQVKFKKHFDGILEKPILTSVIVLIIMAIIITSLSMQYYMGSFGEYWSDILVESHGMLFDIAIIGILIFWLNKSGDVRQRIRTYKDEIDDFRMWESEEAAFRTVGNIKRLNRHNIHEIDLAKCYLAKTNLSHVDLSTSNINSADISNANLIEINLAKSRLNQTNFENSNLNQANLSEAFANGSNFKDSYLIKANFDNAFLIKANFKNAFLMEASLRGCFVTGADFENASLYKADLRGAKGLTIEQLTKTKTLYLAKFDDDILEIINTNIPELVEK